VTRAASPGDEGSTTPVVLGLACVVAVLGLFLTAVTGVAVARHRAAAAADLAALAAAGAVLDGPAAACGLAAEVAHDQGARLVLCALEGVTVDVAVEVRPAGRLAALGVARVRARAGPVT
jgi:secretion/DNA translocation related TadE-like protein